MAVNLEKIRSEFNILGQCKKLRLRLWQCPHFLFVVMGALTVSFMLSSYFYFRGRAEPEMLALIAAGIAAFLLVQTYIILLAFEQVAELNRLKSEFINIMSHQLRSPVTAARWALEFIHERGAKEQFDGTVSQYITILEQSIGRMTELVNSLLSVVRIEANRITFQAKSFALADLLESIIERLRPIAEGLNASIDLQKPEDTVRVSADQEQIRLVAENILDNAIRYVRGKGLIRVWFEKEGGFLKCFVADNGIGIPAAEQGRIFSEFFRASNAYSLVPGGTGIGLFICRELVVRSGGKIGFTSKEDEGTTFWFSLPLAERAS